MCGCLFKISAKCRALTGRKALTKKLLTCSDSFAFESFLKVINKVAVETYFHCIPDYLRKWGSKGGGGTYPRGHLFDIMAEQVSDCSWEGAY